MVDLKKAKQYGQDIVDTVRDIEHLEKGKNLITGKDSTLLIQTGQSNIPLHSYIDPTTIMDIEKYASDRIDKSIEQLSGKLSVLMEPKQEIEPAKRKAGAANAKKPS